MRFWLYILSQNVMWYYCYLYGTGKMTTVKALVAGNKLRKLGDIMEVCFRCKSQIWWTKEVTSNLLVPTNHQKIYHKHLIPYFNSSDVDVKHNPVLYYIAAIFFFLCSNLVLSSVPLMATLAVTMNSWSLSKILKLKVILRMMKLIYLCHSLNVFIFTSYLFVTYLLVFYNAFYFINKSEINSYFYTLP